MWKDSIRNIVVIFQPNILRIVGFYVRHSAKVLYICVGFWLLSHLTRDLSHAEKKIGVVISLANVQNCQSCHFE